MKHNSTWVGMDVHADTIVIAILYGWEDQPRETQTYVPDEKGMKGLIRKLQQLPGEVRCVYEAGACGLWVHRQLKAAGISCDIAAPSLIPRQAGDKVKTDRLDARKLARYHRNRDLTIITIPDEGQEAARDLLRLREGVIEDRLRRRHQLKRFLDRHGYRYREGHSWTEKHLAWMRGIQLKEEDAQLVLAESLLGLSEMNDQVKRLDQQIGKMAQRPAYASLIQRLGALRGVGLLTALTLLVEFGDLRRFGSARGFMDALGLVPSENSSGPRQRRGSITKTGNAHGRRVLVESSWHYRHRGQISGGLKKRREGLPLSVLEIAQKADQRLSSRYWHLMNVGKRSTTAVVAVARELAGFIWALGQLGPEGTGNESSATRSLFNPGQDRSVSPPVQGCFNRPRRPLTGGPALRKSMVH